MNDAMLRRHTFLVQHCKWTRHMFQCQLTWQSSRRPICTKGDVGNIFYKDAPQCFHFFPLEPLEENLQHHLVFFFFFLCCENNVQSCYQSSILLCSFKTRSLLLYFYFFLFFFYGCQEQLAADTWCSHHNKKGNWLIIKKILGTRKMFFHWNWRDGGTRFQNGNLVAIYHHQVLLINLLVIFESFLLKF